MNLRMRAGIFFSAVSTVLFGYANKAMAVGVENTAVTGAFSQLVDDIIATVGPIGLAAVGIAVILLAWRYGRKIFGTVAK